MLQLCVFATSLISVLVFVFDCTLFAFFLRKIRIGFQLNVGQQSYSVFRISYFLQYFLYKTLNA